MKIKELLFILCSLALTAFAMSRTPPPEMDATSLKFSEKSKTQENEDTGEAKAANVKRTQVATLSEEQTQVFVRNVAVRKICEDRIQYLSNLLDEKKLVTTQLVTGLGTYNYQADSPMTFKMGDRTLYRRIEQEGSEPTLEPLYVFEKDEEIKKFRALLQLKSKMDKQVEVLIQLVEENENRITQINRNLEQAFNVLPDKNYHFDNESKTLYLLSAVASE